MRRLRCYCQAIGELESSLGGRLRKGFIIMVIHYARLHAFDAMPAKELLQREQKVCTHLTQRAALIAVSHPFALLPLPRPCCKVQRETTLCRTA